MKLRDYQNDAVESAIRALKHSDKNQGISVPTGAGKSVIIAAIIKELSDNNPAIKILTLAHVKELIVQNAKELQVFAKDIDFGIYSAGLKRKDKGKRIIFSTIATAFISANENPLKSDLGHMDLIIVDEAHRINVDQKGMYHKLISTYKTHCNTKVLGLTATPFRTKTGSIIGPDNILNTICYEIKIPRLIDDGYISKPITMSTINHADTSNIAIKNGDFDPKEAGAVMSKLGGKVMQEILTKARGRDHIICFCCNIDHANVINKRLNEYGVSSMVLHSKLESSRDDIIAKFKDGEIRCLVNVNMLTEGFDAPFIDCVILMRATTSPGLYIQMVGRGFRTFPGKENFLVLDFGENIERHGCIDDIDTQPQKSTKTGIAPIKLCPMCYCAVHISAKDCPNCGHEYVFLESKKTTSSSSIAAILSKDNEPFEAAVNNVQYVIHKKIGKPDSLRVIYNTGNFGFTPYSEYICLYHDGFAQQKAREWWAYRCEHEVPMNIENALKMTKTFRQPLAITIKRDGKYWRIMDYKFEEDKKIDFDPDEDIPF